MRSFAKVFCLSLLSVAQLAGSAQARTINGCEIRPKTNCAGANLRGANLERANLRGADLYRADLERARLSDAILLGARGCDTVRPQGLLNGRGCAN